MQQRMLVGVVFGAGRGMDAKRSRSKPIKQVASEYEVDGILADLQSQSARWKALPLKDKVTLLSQVRDRALKASKVLGIVTAKRAGFADEDDPEAPHSNAASQLGLFIAPTVAKVTSQYIAQLSELDTRGELAPAECARKTADGRSVIDRGLFPDANDLLLAGSRTWLYTQTSAEVTQGKEAAAALAEAGTGPAVVLGGGNQPFLAPEDTLHMLLDKHMPVLLKHHPAQLEAGAIWEYVMEPLADEGFYRGIVADLPMTQAAVYSQRTAAVHMTGALQTHEAILWGPGVEGQQRKAANEPLLQAPITSELGGVTPVFITPGVWSRQDMVRAAQTIWFGATSNAGCNCPTPRAVIMSAEWPQAEEFEVVLGEQFRNSPASPCWYPGAKERYESFLIEHRGYELVSPTVPEGLTYSEEVLPYAFKRVTLDSEEHAASVPGLQEEFFAPVMLLVRVPSSGVAAPTAYFATTPYMIPPPVSFPEEEPILPEDSGEVLDLSEAFLAQIPRFSNQYLHGNLTCSLYLPASIEAALPEASQQCIDELSYGTIVVNGASVVSYSNHLGCWGAHMTPESDPKNVGSGIGKIHNFSQVDGLQKQVTAFPWGATIDLTKIPDIPEALVLPLAGLTSCGLRGLWAAVTP